MPESSARTSARSAPSLRTPLIAVASATSADRWLAWTLLGVLVPWLAYTRLYFFLHPLGLTFDGGFFMWYLHKPDPFCGGTRTFAWMWRGELGNAGETDMKEAAKDIDAEGIFAKAVFGNHTTIQIGSNNIQKVTNQIGRAHV